MLTMNSPPVNSLGTSLVTSFKRFVLFWGSGKGSYSAPPMIVWLHSPQLDAPPEAVTKLRDVWGVARIAAQAGVPETRPRSKGSAGVCRG